MHYPILHTLTEVHKQLHTSSEDCSYMLFNGCQVRISSEQNETILPSLSMTAVRTLLVPTSTAIYNAPPSVAIFNEVRTVCQWYNLPTCEPCCE